LDRLSSEGARVSSLRRRLHPREHVGHARHAEGGEQGERRGLPAARDRESEKRRDDDRDVKGLGKQMS
jgi:hypothetical protein